MTQLSDPGGTYLSASGSASVLFSSQAGLLCPLPEEGQHDCSQHLTGPAISKSQEKVIGPTEVGAPLWPTRLWEGEWGHMVLTRLLGYSYFPIVMGIGGWAVLTEGTLP